MPYFCVHALDRPGMLELRESLRPSHRSRLRTHDHPVIVRIGGPLLDEAEQMIGSMLVIEADSREAVDTYLAGDPYVEAGLYAAVEVHSFKWGLGQPEASNG